MTPWTAAYQAPPSMGFSRQEYWSELPLPSLNEIMEIRNLRENEYVFNTNCNVSYSTCCNSAK